MEAPVTQSVRAALSQLRRDLLGELVGLEQEMQALRIKVAATRRALELVEATERQLAAQEERRQGDMEESASGASAQVRGLSHTAARTQDCPFDPCSLLC
jgi:hypothetical protein